MVQKLTMRYKCVIVRSSLKCHSDFSGTNLICPMWDEIDQVESAIMNTGIVKFFNPTKHYGFIKGDLWKDVFFHLNDYERLGIKRNDGEVVFVGEGIAKRMPQKGDKVVFTASSGNRGIKASPWIFAESFEDAERFAIATVRRVLNVKYRVVHQYSYPGGRKDDPRVIFEGTLRELNLKFPKPKDSRRDDLSPMVDCSDFSVDRWFERKEGDAWICHEKDPRAAVGKEEYQRLKRAAGIFN